MPATEQTWRSLKILHVVFAVAAITLLVATVLMLSADHNRPWKKYARGFRELETWTADARVREQDSETYVARGDELAKALGDARRAAVDGGLAKEFFALVRDIPEDAEAADLAEADVPTLAALREKYDAVAAEIAREPAAEGVKDPRAEELVRLGGQLLAARGDLLARLRDIVTRCKFREDSLAGKLKLRKAELDKNRADYELAVAEDASVDRQNELLAVADAKRAEVTAATLEFQAANNHRKSLEAALARVTASEDVAAKAVADHRAQLVQLQKTYDQRRPNVGKSLLELPVLDAFNSPLKVEQLWLPQLTLNNNFRDVARFDRCTTCHRGMDKTAPGSPTDPAYRPESKVDVVLAAPKTRAESAEVEGDGNAQLEKLFGFHLAPHGLFDADDPTVGMVVPESPAAAAGLMVGDVIESVTGEPMLGRDAAVATFLEAARTDAPVSLEVRRGVPQPYSSHPRLDLFVGDSSPHPMKNFGCTICHQGQGSATAFKWASHTPNTPEQAHEWHDEHGWFNNHHWILPMLPQRFEESSCLKCHHQVVDLEPSERFPDPPAPKLVEGYHLIRQYGCYGCHEINGWAGPEKRIGPDMRVQPGFHEVAEAIGSDPGLAALGSTVAGWVDEVRSGPDGREARERLRDAIERDAAAGKEAKLSTRSHELAVLLKDPETPGTFPKVGPSLRHAASKLNFDWTYAWLRNPQEFRPSTKMPRFFGLWTHLEGKGLEESVRYEPVEIRSMIRYLSASSAPFDYVEPYAGITAKADPGRGKKVVQVRGCLACHQHDDFPEAKSTHGPNLSRMGGKLAGNPKGREWLYSWLREPARYHPKTIMPNVLLEPVTLADGTVSDPAADAVEYLMQSGADWKPAENLAFETLEGERAIAMASATAMSADERRALDELALMYLKERFSAARAEAVLKDGLSADLAGIQGDERMLAGLGSARDETLLRYVGKKTLNKLACYSCHDIPGFEDAKPAGAALADWGRKDPSRIAFEQASHFVLGQLAGAHGAGGHGHGHAHGDAGHGDPSADAVAEEPGASDLAYASTADGHHVDLESIDPDTGYFVQKLVGHEREGFLWQKLRAPRTYDYKKVENKSYNERYRMPQFPFDDAQREAVMTFVLGLVAEPPAAQYVHVPSPREQARLDGLVVAEQYNCGGCHVLQMDRWDIRYQPGSLGPAQATADYPFLQPHFTPPDVAASLVTDRQGRRRASIVGMPVLDPATGLLQYFDEEDVAIPAGDTETAAAKLPVMLWHDALVDGEARPVGGANLLVPLDAIAAGRHYPAHGGDLARLLFPVAFADEKQVNANVKGDDVWGWLPPPLVGEGRKVQSAWLHAFLLNPHPIRPPAVLRMPKFNISSGQAGALVDYFAAVDGAEYPYVADPRLDEGSLAVTERSRPDHLDGALRIITNNNYCVKCHLVGDYVPPGSVKALAPQLARVHERLRPGYVHDWIANPKRFLPYTGMPVNIPFDKPVGQDLYRGTSEQQVAALTDLLMHFDRYATRRLSLDAFLRPPAAPPTAPAQPAAPSPPAAEAAPARVPPAARTDAPATSPAGAVVVN